MADNFAWLVRPLRAFGSGCDRYCAVVNTVSATKRISHRGEYRYANSAFVVVRRVDCGLLLVGHSRRCPGPARAEDWPSGSGEPAWVVVLPVRRSRIQRRLRRGGSAWAELSLRWEDTAGRGEG